MAQPQPLVEQAIAFYYGLFRTVFFDPFQNEIVDPYRRDRVGREIEGAAAAASRSLVRFLESQGLSDAEAAAVLAGLDGLRTLITLDRVSSGNVVPESLVGAVLDEAPVPSAVMVADRETAYRLALHLVIQALAMVGPIIEQWRIVNFAGTFEFLRLVTARLDKISDQMAELARAGLDAVDERFELSYRDYLLQRFHQVAADTVRMTTNLSVDLRRLFVPPRVLSRRSRSDESPDGDTPEDSLMDLARACGLFAADWGEPGIELLQSDEGAESPPGVLAIDQVRGYRRTVIVGAPGAGKSTFLEWLQLQVAAVEEEFPAGGQQAIPLLLRVRELDPKNLPKGAGLIAAATGSDDLATLMPPGWIERQLGAGRVLLILDGLDETEPELRDEFVLPWLADLLAASDACPIVVSSRPVGYPPGLLRGLEFAECDILDFDMEQIAAYTRHWCTAVLLAQNESEEEATRKGEEEGESIVESFREHGHILNLARNPLMLSAICLVNKFEGGQLPTDRGLLYKLCVEGLLHHWDQRRGIHSDYALSEKLAVCREVAIAMQADDRAECGANQVQAIFATALDDEARAGDLLEHIRYRTGLLLERRPGVFAFAHLTFQEYLAACAVLEGNRRGVDADQLAQEHDDPRWKEVIALYCGVAPTPQARGMIENLMACKGTGSFANVLAEAFFSAGRDITRADDLRAAVIERISRAPGHWDSALERFNADEVAPIANVNLGRCESPLHLSLSYF